MNLDVNKYSISELEDILRLRKPYTYEDVAIRIDDYSDKLEDGGIGVNGDMISFLNDVSTKFKLLIESQNKTIATTHPVMHPTINNPNIGHVTRRIVNVDSQFRKNLVNVDNTLSSSTEFNFDLADPLSNVKSLRLYAIHIPSTWYAFSKKQGNTRFFIDTDISINQYDIPDGNYTPNQLVATVNDLINLNHIDISYNSSNYKTTISHDNSNGDNHKFIFYADTDVSYNFSDGCGVRTKINNSLGWALGHRGMGSEVSEEVYSNSQILFPAITESYGPKYFYLVLDDFTNSQLSRGLTNMDDFPFSNSDNKDKERWKYDRVRPPNGSNVLAIISIENLKSLEKGIIPYIKSGLEFNTRVYSSPVDLQRFRVRLVDDRGYTVDLNGADWSFSLLVEEHL